MQVLSRAHAHTRTNERMHARTQAQGIPALWEGLMPMPSLVMMAEVAGGHLNCKGFQHETAAGIRTT